MSSSLQIGGEWPEVVTIRRGWSKAVARPWNEITGVGAARLVRGNVNFLRNVTAWTAERANGTVLSPALYPSATRIWAKAGYEHLLRLEIMENNLQGGPTTSESLLNVRYPHLEELERVDRRAFDEFWHMGQAGLREAISATPNTTTLEFRNGQELIGYAIVGAQVNTSFLQRIAVDPTSRGQGVGRTLLAAAFAWGRKAGANTMILNVRPDNEPARNLYRQAGFRDTGNHLEVLRYRS